jgi:hypothetical protein
MTTQKKSNSKKGKHGGARPGAGRPKKNRAPAIGAQQFETAEQYLCAVVQGTIEPDSVRVRAALGLIRYQETQKRIPKSSPSPKKLAESEKRNEDNAIVEDFETKAREIRERHRKKVKNV